MNASRIAHRPAMAAALGLMIGLMAGGAHAADPPSRSTTQQPRQPAPATADPRLYTPQLQSVMLLGSGFDGGVQSAGKSYTRNIKVSASSTGAAPTHMQVAESASLTGVAWLPIPADGKLNFVLSDGEGLKTVYVKLKRHGNPTGYSAVKSAQITYHVPPTIGSFRIDNGAPSTTDTAVQLNWSISGTATHYRVHHQTSFSSINWQAMSAAVANGVSYELPGDSSGQRQVYLQIRRDQSAIAGATDTIALNLPQAATPQTCPTGPNGVVCSGNGLCSAGQCSCNPDYSGNACQTICQRCYGAVGNNCGAADGFNLGLCIGNQCTINAGSWAHDECCVARRRNGPAAASLQGSCSPPGTASPPHVCQVEFNKAVAHVAAGLSWVRTVNTSTQRCTTTTMTVDHNAMCNPSGGTLLCSDQQLCCSRSARRVPNPPGVNLDLCLCD